MGFLSYNYKYSHPITRYLLHTPRIDYVYAPSVPCMRGVDQTVDQNGLNDAKIYVKLYVSSQEKLVIAGRATDL